MKLIDLQDIHNTSLLQASEASLISGTEKSSLIAHKDQIINNLTLELENCRLENNRNRLEADKARLELKQ